jgi:hypothetical protein
VTATLHEAGCTHGPGHEHVAAPASRFRMRSAATRGGAATMLAGLAAVTAWVLVRNPLETTVFPPCPLHASTGLWCPGCGATRASYLLLHGDIAGALHFNALWVLLAPLALYQAVAVAGEAFGVRWLKRIPLSQTVIVALVASLLGFAVVRNLPIETLEVLNPIGNS